MVLTGEHARLLAPVPVDNPVTGLGDYREATSSKPLGAAPGIIVKRRRASWRPMSLSRDSRRAARPRLAAVSSRELKRRVPSSRQ